MTPGQAVTAAGRYVQSCPSDPPTTASFTLFARSGSASGYQAVQTVQDDAAGNFRFDPQHPSITTTYTIGMSSDPVNGPYDYLAKTVTVDFPCAKPQAHFFTFTPTRVAAGDTVHLRGSIQDLCQDSQPADTLTVYAQRAGDAERVGVATVTSDTHGGFAVDLVVTETETLSVRRGSSDELTYYDSPAGGRAVVTVDRVSGSCAGAVSLTGPSLVHLGDLLTIRGQRSDTSTVTILARKRGAAAFTALTTSTPDAAGRFSAEYRALDDYRLLAQGERCDSLPLLMQIMPTISGTPRARPGAAVSLQVVGPPGAPVAVYFHRAGTNGFVKRRAGTLSGTGTYGTSYIASDDYRYYAVVGNDRRISNVGLTRIH